MTDSEQCGAGGPGGLVCTRHGSDHTTHVAYMKSDGQLYHVEWFACNSIGEPTGETIKDAPTPDGIQDALDNMGGC